MGEFGKLDWKLMNLEFEIRPGIYLHCHNYECYGSMVWEGGKKAAVGGYTGVVINEPCHVLPVLEWRWMWWSWMKDAMPPRDFLHNNGMMLSPMNDENSVPVKIFTLFFFHELSPTFLMNGPFFVGGAHSSSSFFLLCCSLGPLSLCSTEVLLSGYHSTQLFCPYIKKFTGFLGSALVWKASSSTSAIPLQPGCMLAHSLAHASCKPHRALAILPFQLLPFFVPPSLAEQGWSQGFRNFSGTFSWTRGSDSCI